MLLGPDAIACSERRPRRRPGSLTKGECAESREMAKWQACPELPGRHHRVAGAVTGDPSTLPGAFERMAIEVETKDCTALSDAELAEMADICADGPARFEVGLLSKQTEAWVLVTRARRRQAQGLLLLHARAHRWHARACCIGLALDAPHLQARRGAAGDHDRPVPPGRAGLPRRGRAGRHPLHQRRRASRRSRRSTTSFPVPATRPSGEERAWGRRLAKRFGVENGGYDDQTFLVSGDGDLSRSPRPRERSSPRTSTPTWSPCSPACDADAGDSLIAFGWAMAEDLAKLGSH